MTDKICLCPYNPPYRFGFCPVIKDRFCFGSNPKKVNQSYIKDK